MKFRHLIRALGTQFVLGNGLELDFPFGTINVQAYKMFGRLQFEFLSTGFELLRMAGDNNRKAYCFLGLKILGNVFRIDTEARVSFLSLVSYIKNYMSEYEQVENLSEGSQI